MFFRKRNTVQRGQVRFIVFEDEGTWYGVALELNIVVDAESHQQALVELTHAVRDYVHTVHMSKLRDSVLNQEVSNEYAQLWKDLENGKKPTIRRISEDDSEGEKTHIQVAQYGFIPQLAC
ncbi:MAG: hypothetical protein V1778_01550 [bacterium]